MLKKWQHVKVQAHTDIATTWPDHAEPREREVKQSEYTGVVSNLFDAGDTLEIEILRDGTRDMYEIEQQEIVSAI